MASMQEYIYKNILIVAITSLFNLIWKLLIIASFVACFEIRSAIILAVCLSVFLLQKMKTRNLSQV